MKKHEKVQPLLSGLLALGGDSWFNRFETYLFRMRRIVLACHLLGMMANGATLRNAGVAGSNPVIAPFFNGLFINTPLLFR